MYILNLESYSELVYEALDLRLNDPTKHVA
jgi:hypothetical protein